MHVQLDLTSQAREQKRAYNVCLVRMLTAKHPLAAKSVNWDVRHLLLLLYARLV